MQYNVLIYLGKNLLLPAWRRKFYVYLLILFFIYVTALYLGYYIFIYFFIHVTFCRPKSNQKAFAPQKT